eukprot:maker-scaffold119_size336447-snap-gene-2.28 protein:Tk11783 transcript:maker-scaffold119_size336447-snap-gene-2.28-mRNA-1 annotation:"hypothetical protein"
MVSKFAPRSLSIFICATLTLGFIQANSIGSTGIGPDHSSLRDVHISSSDLLEPFRGKRSSVEFMGMTVSYPQYIRLRNIQREVIRMDKVIRRMRQTRDPMELAQNPHWTELMELYDALKSMLPVDYNDDL